MFNTGELESRYELADLCNSLGLDGWAVEIGTDRGVFAHEFLKRWQGHTFYCVDPYKDDIDGYDDDIRWPRLPDLLLATSLLSQHVGRVRFVQMTSEHAAGALNYMTPHFVYVDGNHDYEFVKRDLELWWPRLRDGGLMSGHDIEMPGVKRAVEEFFKPIGRTVLLTREPEYKSWYVRK